MVGLLKFSDLDLIFKAIVPLINGYLNPTC